MNDLRRLFGATDLPGRPLLFAAGAAATTAGVFYFMMKRDDGEKTAEDQILTEVSESDMVSDVDDVRVPQSDSAVPEAPLTETEEKYKLVIASCTQLKKEMAGLMSEVNTVHDLVEELKKERLKKQLQNEELVMECQMKSVAISILEAHDKAIRSSLQKEFEEKRQAHSELKNQCDQMKKTLRGKKVSLADIEEQYQDLVRSGNNMVCQVKSLILEVYQAKKQQQVRLENNKVRNDHNILKSEYEQMKKTHKMVSLDEAEKMLLLKKMSDMMSQKHKLHASVQQLKEAICETCKKCNEIKRKQEQTQEVHSNLKAQHTTMMDIFKQFYELLENHLKHEEPEEPQEPGEPGDPQEPRKAEEPGETGEPEEPRKS
ncbi:leucine-rich repeat flightless-interacting protein 2-like [Tachysurus ichikawai]